MKKDDLFLAKPFSTKRFEEKRFVNVSVCQSNIKAKKGTYYGRVCKMGHINTKQVLALAKDRSPHINIPLIESALETIADVIFDMAGQGYSVEFANLGTFSLSTQGRIEMSEEVALQDLAQSTLQERGDSTDDLIDDSLDNSINNFSRDDIEDLIDELKDGNEVAGNYDVSEKVKKDVNFTFKFSPSKTLKASMKNIKMNLAIKKRHAPIIKEVEDALPDRTLNCPNSPSVLKISGNALKIMGDDEKVGIYIEEKNFEKTDPNRMKYHRDKIIKVPFSSIIQNENKTLTFLLDERLKQGATYSITIITQGVSGGKLGNKIRYTKCEFVWRR